MVVAEESRSFRGDRGLAASAARRLLGLLLHVEALLNLLGVTFVVELQQALKHLSAGGFADGEADALLSLVVVVPEVEASPAVGGDHCAIHL
jgi:hypothetical protein